MNKDTTTTPTITPLQLAGKDERWLVDFPDGSCKVHKNIVEPLQQLIQLAAAHGFQLAVASGFRDFNRQCRIWNEKISGLRNVVDDSGQCLDLAALSDWEKVQAVLRWSALPGTSRHHWGTDIDIYEKSAMPENYQLQLSLEETRVGGVFEDFYRWLDKQFDARSLFGFFRPYFPSAVEIQCNNRSNNKRGVASEPWHLSHGPTAYEFQQRLNLETARQIIATSDILLRDTVLQHFEEIFRDYILVSGAGDASRSI